MSEEDKTTATDRVIVRAEPADYLDSPLRFCSAVNLWRNSYATKINTSGKNSN
jgi:hypothetical protein